MNRIKKVHNRSVEILEIILQLLLGLKSSALVLAGRKIMNSMQSIFRTWP